MAVGELHLKDWPSLRGEASGILLWFLEGRGSMRLLFALLEQVADPRTGNATRHNLLDVLTIALVASICGCESCVEFADFAADRETFF